MTGRLKNVFDPLRLLDFMLHSDSGTRRHAGITKCTYLLTETRAINEVA